MVLTDKLTSIADAIREKGGTSEKIKLDAMPQAILDLPSGGGADLPEEALVISGECDYRFANGGWDWYINEFGNRVTTEKITSVSHMFDASNVSKIPFVLNFDTSSSYHDATYVFNSCENLTEAPKIIGLKPSTFLQYFFQNCRKLREVPEDYFDAFDFSYIGGLTGNTSGAIRNIYSNCYGLRKAPISVFNKGNKKVNQSYAPYREMFASCYSLDEAINIPAGFTNTWTSNAFTNMANYCSRLKNLTFETNDDGSPIVVNWKSQTIELHNYVGYASNASSILNWNSGITRDTQVNSDETYQALKNDPDWYTADINYSRYNHDSAVATINSLPDTSAYLATAGGTNTIKFRGAAGSLTDGGAINTLTAEEIAVATAKGWTVSLV